VSDEVDLPDVERVEHGDDVGDELGDGVGIDTRRPRTGGVPALVEGDDAVSRRREQRRHLPPARRGLRESVEKQDGTTVGGTVDIDPEDEVAGGHVDGLHDPEPRGEAAVRP
jgi:hypothetical protein